MRSLCAFVCDQPSHTQSSYLQHCPTSWTKRRPALLSSHTCSEALTPRRTTIPAAQSFTEPRHHWQLTGTSRLDNENPTNVTRMHQHNACSWQVADGVNRLQEAHLWSQASRHTSHHCSILFIEKNLTISKEQEYKQHLSHSKEENIKHMSILESSWCVCFWSLWGDGGIWSLEWTVQRKMSILKALADI